MTTRRSLLTVAALFLLCRILFAAESQVNLLAMGDWGSNTADQEAVAQAMENYVTKHHLAMDAVLLVGDNFYVNLTQGIDDPDWKKLFELMYDPRKLAMPFYAVLGNHDYENNKAQIELDYSKSKPTSRFKLPAPWYHVDVPKTRPLVALIGLDSNIGPLGAERWAEEAQWLEAELAKPGRPRWTICYAHHPLFSGAKHGDDPELQKSWGPIFKEHRVDFYLCGHDHALEHLQVPGWPTSFLVTGGGGAAIYPIQKRDHAVFAESQHGFVHLQISATKVRVTFLDKTGKALHMFDRDAKGEVKVIPQSP